MVRYVIGSCTRWIRSRRRSRDSNSRLRGKKYLRLSNTILKLCFHQQTTTYNKTSQTIRKRNIRCTQNLHILFSLILLLLNCSMQYGYSFSNGRSYFFFLASVAPTPTTFFRFPPSAFSSSSSSITTSASLPASSFSSADPPAAFFCGAATAFFLGAGAGAAAWTHFSQWSRLLRIQGWKKPGFFFFLTSPVGFFGFFGFFGVLGVFWGFFGGFWVLFTYQPELFRFFQFQEYFKVSRL